MSLATQGKDLLRNLRELSKGRNLIGQIENLKSQMERNPATVEAHQAAEAIRELIERHYFGAEVPPEKLRMHVGARPSAINFWEKGIRSSAKVLEVFGEAPSGPILDWGCGSGRTLLWLRFYSGWRANYRGCDVDREAIRWLLKHGESSVAVCNDDPPLPYEDATFDGLFAFSVLTHIPPEKHRAWYAEIRRILKPGTRAYFTTHGERMLGGEPEEFSEEIKAQFKSQGYGYVKGEGHYMDWSHVSEAFTRHAVSGLLDIDRYAEADYYNQDGYLVRRPFDGDVSI